MSGMAVMAGGPTAKENREVREGGSEPRAHLLEQLAGEAELSRDRAAARNKILPAWMESLLPSAIRGRPPVERS